MSLFDKDKHVLIKIESARYMEYNIAMYLFIRHR